MSFSRVCLFFLLLVIAPTAFTQLPVRDNATAGRNAVYGYIERSKAYEATQPDSAVDYCNRGMKLAEELNDLEGQGLVLLQFGRINRLHHHTDLARRFTNEALSIFRNLHSLKGIALAYDALGLLDGQLNNLSDATGEFNRSMQFYEDTRDSAGIAATYHNLGTVYEEKGEAEKALTFYLRALVQYEHRSQKPEDYFVLLENISRLYTRKGDRQAALHYLYEGVRNSDTPQLRSTELTMLEDEGKIEETAGESTQALLLYKKELGIAKMGNNLEGQARALASIADVLKKDSAVRSLAYLREALNIVAGLQQPQLKANIFEAMAGVYRQQKNYREAMLMLEEHNRLLDSLLTTNTHNEIAALDSSYVLETTREQVGQLQEVNKQERTALNLGLVIVGMVIAALVLLGLYLRKIKRLNGELHESNEARNTLFSIIGHDLKGPAGNAVQLLEIIETAGLPEDMLKKMLSELKKQSVASFDLLNALFEWGKAQLHGVEVKPEIIETKPLIQKNIHLLAQQAARKNIMITDLTPEDAKIYADPNHFHFVIRNLLSNAVKFTHEQGRIDIYAAVREEEIVYSVKDTGIGIGKAMQLDFIKKTLPVSFGTKGEKGSGLGLMLIKEFMRANKGRIWLESKEGEGTTFYCSFPVAPATAKSRPAY